jgi:hypothetical protein
MKRRRFFEVIFGSVLAVFLTVQYMPARKLVIKRGWILHEGDI